MPWRRWFLVVSLIAVLLAGVRAGHLQRISNFFVLQLLDSLLHAIGLEQSEYGKCEGDNRE